MMRKLIYVMFLFFFSLPIWNQANGTMVDNALIISGDISETAPDRAFLIFENDYASVIKMVLLPGDELPKHFEGARVIYPLTDCRLEIDDDNVHRIEVWYKGNVRWQDRALIQMKNIGKEEAQFLVVSRKAAGLPAFIPSQINFDIEGKTEIQDRMTLYDNVFVRVIMTYLNSFDRTPRHFDLNRIEYAMSSFKERYTIDHAGTIERVIPKGETHWHDADINFMKNIGATQARLLMFQFKQ